MSYHTDFFSHLDAADNARLLCDQFYFASPDLIIREHNGNYCLSSLSLCVTVLRCH